MDYWFVLIVMGNDSILMLTYLPGLSHWVTVCSKFRCLAYCGEWICRQIAWGRLTEPKFHPFPLYIFPFFVPKSKHFICSSCMWIFLGDILDRCAKNVVYTEMWLQLQLTATAVVMAPAFGRRTSNAASCSWEEYCMAGECIAITDLFFK